MILRKAWDLNFSFPSPTTSTPTSATTLPQTSPSRLSQSLLATQSDLSSNPTPDKTTILYLAYGSNLSAETFKGVRGIKPLSSINVQVPILDLTFDLPGIPYSEPCFANTRYRKPPPPLSSHQYSSPSQEDRYNEDEYYKTRWEKGLVGVVYEVTPSDYAIIIATEGGGASYHDILVPCYAIPKGTKILDPNPKTLAFKAHTLFSPQAESPPIYEEKGIVTRPDPNYAQASARYLKLITNGAEEHDLPADYQSYLSNLHPYTITTRKQILGKILFLAIWAPIIAALLGLSKFFADEKGRIPKWLVVGLGRVFSRMWRSYDGVFRGVFGDGERTMREGDGYEEGTGGREG